MDADRRELHQLVDALPDDQTAPLLADLRNRLTTGVSRRWPPAFFGMGADRGGSADLSERVDAGVRATGPGASGKRLVPQIDRPRRWSWFNSMW